MASTTLQVFLRVLYTVNSNPQYILAKSASQVPATPATEPTYARAPLKASLTAICDSSPELFQDPARDFSLYVLDPLEVQPLPMGLAPTHSTNATNSPRGVAVALGLMSWALESDDSQRVLVTGTIVPGASPALEVVFALRETKRMPKPFPAFVPGSTVPPPQPGAMTWSYTSYPLHGPQERPTLTRSVDFPELYIGPPRRARGRPEGSTSSKSKSASQSGDAGRSSHQEAVKKAKTRTKPRPPRAPAHPPAHSPFIRAPLTRTEPEKRETSVASLNHPAYPPAQPYSHPTHNPLLGLLSAISATSSGDDSTTTPQQQQAALLSVLQGLLSNPQLMQLTATNAPDNNENKPKAENKADDDGDSDIVILDSSTVDASVFRKRNGMSSDHETTASTDSPMPSGQSTDSSHAPASTPPSGVPSSDATTRSGAETPTLRHVSSKRAASTLGVPSTPTPPRVRKRKLGEYVHGQHSFTSPPSPSTRTSSSGRVCARPPDLVLPKATRLPSMLGSMRAASASTRRSDLEKYGHASLAPKAEASTSNEAMSDMTSLKRRRTLNEFMAEQEARNCVKARKRSSSGRKLEVDASAAPRSTRVASTSKLGSSPPRLLFRSDALMPLLVTATSQPVLMPGASISNMSSMSTTSAQTKNPLINFVLPAWARTSTAMQPRLSDEALARQRAEQETKMAQISSRRREAARAKRKRLDVAGPSKESSEDDDEPDVTVHMPPPPLAALPVFASDAVEPIAPSSPPMSPRTPPRQPISARTPSKSGCSLFSPSHDALFTPSTPSVARSTRVEFTPRTPTVRGSPLKLQTPRRSVQAPRVVSPSKQAMATRAFLLPPPSPCAARSFLGDVAPSPTLGVEGKGRHEDDVSGADDPVGKGTLERSTPRPSVDEGADEPCDEGVDPDTETGYASSALPPSSPLPTTPFSSPAHLMDDLPPLHTTDSDVPPAWFTDSDAWLTETEAWLTDTELPTEDGAWLSDSDGVFGDMSSLPASTASDWLSDGLDGDGMHEADAVALERAFTAFVDGHEGEVMDKELWDALKPLLGGNGDGDREEGVQDSIRESLGDLDGGE